MEPLTLTIIGAARALRISRTKAYAMARSGELPTFRIGRAVRVPIAELRAWIASRSRMPRESAFPENHDGTRKSASPKHR
jgi:excisionase family DNA binding protein